MNMGEESNRGLILGTGRTTTMETCWAEVARNELIVHHAGTNPGAVAVNLDGAEVWVDDYRSTSFNVVDVPDGTVTKAIH